MLHVAGRGSQLFLKLDMGFKLFFLLKEFFQLV
jgi:hypothetical protein